MHLPELPLRAGAHRGLRRRTGVCVLSERQVDVCESDFAAAHGLVAELPICLIVPLLAERTLEVAHLDHPEGCGGTPLDAGEVGPDASESRGRQARLERRGAAA